MSSLQWATTVLPISFHRPFFLAPATMRVTSFTGFSLTQLQASASLFATAAKKEAARLLPDDKPLDVPASLHFPWEGGESQRSLLLLDGNAILYRAYFKIMAKVQYGSLKDMGSEADWVLTVFTALSTAIRLLEIQPTHVAAAFDYKGLTFRHELYQPYKSGRPPTPDTVCQALSCLKPALLSLGISVVEVAGKFLGQKSQFVQSTINPEAMSTFSALLSHSTYTAFNITSAVIKVRGSKRL